MTERNNIMLAYQYDERRLLRWPRPWIVQPKIEGDRMRCDININGTTLLSSSSQEKNFALPHIASELRLKDLIELDGEAYTHGMPHEDIHSIFSRTVGLHPHHEELQYHIFDMVSDMEQGQRIDYLQQWFDDHTFRYVELVPSHFCGTIEEVEWYYKEFCDKGYEGIILRHAYAPYVRKKTTTMMKLKPRKSMLCIILKGFQEISIHGKPKNALGGFTVQNADEAVFRVGSGFTRAQREQWWPLPIEMLGRVIRIHYQELTKHGIPKMSSFKEVVDHGNENDS